MTTTEIEEEYVKNVYNKISDEFSVTRYRPWTCVESFLDKIDDNKKIGDIGSKNKFIMYDGSPMPKEDLKHILMTHDKQYSELSNKIKKMIIDKC